MSSEFNVGMAYNSFFSYFEGYYPNLKVVKTPDQIKEADLVIFSGGEDINPNVYGQTNKYSHGMNRGRDAVEQEIFKYCRYLHTPVLGICRGHQLINALLGGVMIQDIFFQKNVNHPHTHPIENIADGSFIQQHFNRNVNSLHHQGITIGGDGLRTTSSYRGISESTEGELILTFQFHPEFMGKESINLFEEIKKWAIKAKKG